MAFNLFAILLTLGLYSPPAACSASPAYHAMDFTLGTWAVRVPGSSSPATSTVQFEVKGCAVVESWRGQNDAGLNVDAYNAEDGHWHRFFVDAYGKVHYFEGKANGKSVLYEGRSTGPGGQVTLNRLTITRKGPDALNQLWEKSRDGKTWTVAFQGVYTRIRR